MGAVIVILSILCVGLCTGSGCSKDEIKQALDQAKSQTKSLTESAVQVVEDRLPESGSVSLESSPPTSPIGQLDLRLITIGDGRPNVVQMVSYEVVRPGRSFPAIMFQGTTVTPLVSSLVGETVDCDVYYQAQADTPVAITKPGASAAISFESYSEKDNTLHASVAAFELLGSDGRTVDVQAGQLVAVIRTVGN